MAKTEQTVTENIEAGTQSVRIDSRQLAYPRRGTVDSEMRRPIWVASFAAVVIQWSTIGASLLIAYKTPTEGLSCRSGSYLIYGVLGTFVWLSLLTSMLLSHKVMLRYQEEHEKDTSKDFSLQEEPDNAYRRTSRHAWLCATAVILRRIGKFVAVVNALWLIVSSLLEFTGLYDNCWCSSVQFSLREHAWIVLFKGKEDLRTTAIGPWVGGLAMTLIVCTVACICFDLGCRKKSDD